MTESPELTNTSADAIAAPVVEVSIIVPTRNESGNVAALVRGLEQVMSRAFPGSSGGLGAEIIFVDDSDDETPEAIREAARSSLVDVRLLHREPGRRDGGLGGAVLSGFRVARGRWAVVMDGDLQHPPEKVPALIAAATTAGADIAYGTRYTGGFGTQGLDGRYRQLASAWSTRAARALFPRRLRGVSDPMSGFFAVRLAAIDLNRLRPVGFKIMLELLTRGNLSGVVGVPYEFQARYDGESKASVKEGMTYLRHLLVLRLGLAGARLAQLIKFLLVGASGIVVNTAALWLLSSVWSLPYLSASVLATQIAILWNFLLLERLVFHDSGRGFLSGLARFWLLNLVLLPVQLGLLALAVEVLTFPPVPANIIVLTAVFGLRYVFTAGWVFRWRADPLDVVAGTAPGRRRWVDIDSAAFVARLCGPGLLTLCAFPGLLRNVIDILRSEDAAATLTLIAVVVASLALVVAQAAPGPDEPPVHDRQVDAILALVFGGAALWLTFGWHDPFRWDAPPDARLILAATAFLVAACLILLGTRMTARIRWALASPLLILFPMAGAAMLGEVAAWIYVACSALAFARWLRSRGGQPGRLQIAHQQFRPPLVPGLPVTAAFAALIGATAVLAQTGVLT